MPVDSAELEERDEREMWITKVKKKVLEVLSQNPDKVFSSDELQDMIKESGLLDSVPEGDHDIETALSLMGEIDFIYNEETGIWYYGIKKRFRNIP